MNQPTRGVYEPDVYAPASGAYDLGGVYVYIRRRPHWLARLLCRWLLDWQWKDVG